MSVVDDPMIGLILLVFALLVCAAILLAKRPPALEVPVPARRWRSGEPGESVVEDVRP